MARSQGGSGSRTPGIRHTACSISETAAIRRHSENGIPERGVRKRTQSGVVRPGVDCGTARESVYTRAPTKPLAQTGCGEKYMARGARVVVQADRLRDQVYELIRDDMRSGVLTPGQRLVEVDLAEK